MAAPVDYKGVRLEDLRIERVEWDDEASEHIRTRRARKGPAETDIEPEWATEAALADIRLVAVAPSDSPDTASLRVVGYSEGASALLKVWLWSDDPSGSATWNGASACLANVSDIRKHDTYRKAREEEDDD
jgi:hypothetical protein